jgi:hypothetical protein
MYPINPISNPCVFRFSQDGTQKAYIKAEEATDRDEVQKALNARSFLQFRQPFVLLFSNPACSKAVRFGFSFDIEVLVVGMSGLIEKAYTVSACRQGDALTVHFFSGYEAAILVPAGFIKNWVVEPGKTRVKRTSFADFQRKFA